MYTYWTFVLLFFSSENKLSDKITFIKGKLEEISLPVEKV